jgi:hypothetical protein
MSLRVKRPKLRGKAGAVAVSVAAVLALSGCWAGVDGHGGGNKTLAIGQKATNQMIFICTAQNPGAGHNAAGVARARCVLNLTRSLCRQIPIHNWTSVDCQLGTDEYQVHISSVERAIFSVLDGADCLAIDKFYIGALGIWAYSWKTVNRVQSSGCTFSQ